MGGDERPPEILRLFSPFRPAEVPFHKDRDDNAHEVKLMEMSAHKYMFGSLLLPDVFTTKRCRAVLYPMAKGDQSGLEQAACRPFFLRKGKFVESGLFRPYPRIARTPANSAATAVSIRSVVVPRRTD
jgi:hypothetical protein